MYIYYFIFFFCGLSLSSSFGFLRHSITVSVCCEHTHTDRPTPHIHALCPATNRIPGAGHTVRRRRCAARHRQIGLRATTTISQCRNLTSAAAHIVITKINRPVAPCRNRQLLFIGRHYTISACGRFPWPFWVYADDFRPLSPHVTSSTVRFPFVFRLLRTNNVLVRRQTVSFTIVRIFRG